MSEIEIDSETTIFVQRYIAVWNEPDIARRTAAVAALWAADGVEFVEGAQFRGIDALDSRIATAYDEFVGSGRFRVSHAAAVRRHDDLVTFTIQLVTDADVIAWAARVFVLLDANGRIREDYHLTVQQLAAQ